MNEREKEGREEGERGSKERREGGRKKRENPRFLQHGAFSLITRGCNPIGSSRWWLYAALRGPPVLHWDAFGVQSLKPKFVWKESHLESIFCAYLVNSNTYLPFILHPNALSFPLHIQLFQCVWWSLFYLYVFFKHWLCVFLV